MRLVGDTREELVYWSKAYLSTLASLPNIFKRSAFRRRSLQSELNEAMMRGTLRKAFGAFDVFCLGLGVVIASGWAQLLGTAALYAGPAVIVSVMVSGLAALLSAACFAELCVEYPLSGGAFSYIMITFGELPSFITLAALLLEYAIGMAVVARGFSTYVARLINQGPGFFRVGAASASGGQLDLLAAGIVLLISLLLSLGVRESVMLISGVTVVKMVLLLMLPIVGFTASSVGRMTPFLSPIYQTDGMFLGAATLFFMQAGFDALGAAAEEVQDIRHIPWALMGTVCASTTIYLLLALSLVLMTCPNIACPACPFFSELLKVNFVTAFNATGMPWMQYIVSVAALCGILTSLTVGLFSISRVVMVASRDWLLPPVLARVSPRTQTPVVAQLLMGVIIAIIGMLVPTDNAGPLVSFGALLALWMVCNAQMYRRYFPERQLRATRHGSIESAEKQATTRARWCAAGRRMDLSVTTRKALVWGHMLAVNGTALALSSYYQANAVGMGVVPKAAASAEENCAMPPPPPWLAAPPGAPPPGVPPPLPTTCVAAVPEACGAAHAEEHQGIESLWFLLAWLLATLSFQFWCRLEYEPSGWKVPWWLMPWLPSLAVLVLTFSVAALPNTDLWFLGIYFAAALALYLLVAMPCSHIKHAHQDAEQTDENNVVELVVIDGRWQPSTPAQPSMSVQPSFQTLAQSSSTARTNSQGTGRTISQGIYSSHGVASSNGTLTPHLSHVERAHVVAGAGARSAPVSRGGVPATVAGTRGATVSHGGGPATAAATGSIAARASR